MFTADFSHDLDHGSRSWLPSNLFVKSFTLFMSLRYPGRCWERTKHSNNLVLTKTTPTKEKATNKSLSEPAWLMDSDRLFQEVSLDKVASIFWNKVQSLKELGSRVKSFIYCMEGQDHWENFPHVFSNALFLGHCGSCTWQPEKFSFSPMRRPPKQAQKGFPDHFATTAQSTPLSTCFPVSLDLSLHLFVSLRADP